MLLPTSEIETEGVGKTSPLRIKKGCGVEIRLETHVLGSPLCFSARKVGRKLWATGKNKNWVIGEEKSETKKRVPPSTANIFAIIRTAPQSLHPKVDKGP
jgi:hypothetical protein